MLMDRNKSSLLVVDVQARLLPAVALLSNNTRIADVVPAADPPECQLAMPAIADGETVLANCIWLARVAQRLDVPVVVSEQYPEGLGRTAGPLLAAVSEAQVVTKTHFSCVSDGCLAGTPVEARRQVVVVGTEAHVCVLQTVLELCWQGKEVFVVADAVGSRKPADREAALERMRRHGVEIVTREMVAFEWLQRSATPLFREINRDFIRDN